MLEPFASMPEPTASGDFTRTPVSHLLIYALERGLSGTIELSASPDESATVIFASGRPVKARTSAPVAYLGRVLVELGAFDAGQLGETLEIALQHKLLHGQVLRSRGLVTPEQLAAGLREQLVRKLRYLTRLPPETSFRYYADVDGLAAYGGEIRVTVEPHAIIWAHIREAPSPDHLRTVLARVGNAGLRLAGGADLDRFALDKAERATAELLRDDLCSAADVMAAGILDPRLAERLLYCLIASKQVEAPGEAAPLTSGRSMAPSVRTPSTTSAGIPAVVAPSARPPSVPPKPPSVPPRRPSVPAITTSYEDAGGGFVQRREQFEIIKPQAFVVDPTTRAAESHQHALEALANDDLEKAVACAKNATLDDPGSAEYLALYGWVVGLRAVKLDRAPAEVAIETEIGIEKIDAALRMDPKAAEPYYHRYMLKKRLGREAEAIEDLHRAIEHSKGKVDWQRELRLIDMRKEREQREAEEKEARGLLGRVFKK